MSRSPHAGRGLSVVAFLVFGMAPATAVERGGPAEGDPAGNWSGRVPPSGLRLASIPALAAPTGSLLAFSAWLGESWDIYTWDMVAGHSPVQLTRTPYDEAAPTLAADHSACVFESVDGRLWRLPLGSNGAAEELPFGSDQRFDMHPAVSRDGQRIAMATSLNRATDDTDLIVYDAKARTFGRRLELMSYQHYPAWAPDGVHLAFSNLHGRLQSGRPICELWVMRGDAPWARQLTLLDGLAISPSWSPLGDRIAFACDQNGQFDIWLLDPFSRQCHALTTDEASDTDPVFSPDGRSVIFVSTRGARLGLWRVDLDGREPRPVRPFGDDSTALCKDPDWK